MCIRDRLRPREVLRCGPAGRTSVEPGLLFAEGYESTEPDRPSLPVTVSGLDVYKRQRPMPAVVEVQKLLAPKFGMKPLTLVPMTESAMK